MAIQKYKPEQIVTLLRQIEVSIGNGKTTPQAQQQYGMTERHACRLLEQWRGPPSPIAITCNVYVRVQGVIL